MNIYISSTSEAQALLMEKALVLSGVEEVSSIYHHETFIYFKRSVKLLGEVKAISLISKAETILICQSDQVLMLQENQWVRDLCEHIGIPVITEVSDLSVDANLPVDPRRDAPIDTVERYCGGCPISKDTPILIKNCSSFNDGCSVYDDEEDAWAGG